VLSQSVIARAEDTLQRSVTSAFAKSRSHAAANRLIQSFRTLSTAARVRLSGVALLTFVVVHLGWRFAMPAGAAPAMPLAVWAWLALIALSLILAPRALVHAWRAHRNLRLREPD
jgi:succinate dehydrogenase hydrophobic anchor subunit